MNEIKKFVSKCEYYRRNPSYESFASLTELPIIDRNIVRDNNQEFTIDKSPKNAVIRETSGSTGTIIRVAWNASDYYASLKPIWKIRKSFGVNASDNYIADHSWITNTSINSSVKILIENNKISLSKIYVDDDTLESYCRIISQYTPTWMMISPSFAVLLGNFCQKHKIYFDFLKLIELSGEYVSDECHKNIDDLFRGVPIRNQYGMTECNVIAYEYDTSNVLEACSGNVIEILDDNGNQCEIGETGNIIVTNLPNKNMPLIRYKTGDMATLYDSSYGRQRFKIVSSRETDYYVYENKRFHSSLFYCIIQQYNSQYPDAVIDQFLFVDEGEKHLSAYIHIKIGQDTIDGSIIEKRLESIFQSTIDVRPSIAVSIVHDMPEISKKKNYYIVNNKIVK